MTDAEPPRAHRAARLEKRIRAFMEPRRRRRGWLPAVVPHLGYGGDGWARVLARVVLVPPGWSAAAREDGRGWRRFLTTSAPGVPVTVRSVATPIE